MLDEAMENCCMVGTYQPKLLCAGIDRFPRCRILVVGDVMVDEYVWGLVSRISPEAPVPVVEVLDCQEDLRLGGAGNVAHNIGALRGQSILCGVKGSRRCLKAGLKRPLEFPGSRVAGKGRPQSIRPDERG
jgi:hypothetical protein